MSIGYTTRLLKINSAADQTLLGVKFGRFCIRNDISVTEVANIFGVSRQAVYNWFSGENYPIESTAEKIENFISKNK
jgi:predicted DNA-binding protein YlxM (UPF0122 family)